MRLLRMRLRDDLPNPHGEERGQAARLEPEATDPSRRGEVAAPQDKVRRPKTLMVRSAATPRVSGGCFASPGEPAAINAYCEGFAV
jgi:hypothetical protein